MIFAIPFYYRSTYLNKVTKNVYSINYQVNQYMITCIVGEIKFIFKHLTLVSILRVITEKRQVLISSFATLPN